MLIVACVLMLVILYLIGYIFYCRQFINTAEKSVGIIVTDESGKKVCQYSVNGQVYQKNILSAKNSKINSKGQLEVPIIYSNKKPNRARFGKEDLELIIKIYGSTIPIVACLALFSLGVYFNVNYLSLTAVLIITLFLFILSSIRILILFLQSLKKED